MPPRRVPWRSRCAAAPPRGAPYRTILAAATEAAPWGETDSTVSRTARTRSAVQATFLSVVFACHLP